MKRIQQKCIVPSAALSVPRKLIRHFEAIPERRPRVGDLVFGEVASLGFHTQLESVSSRLHMIHDRTRAIFVYGTRYAPDQFEGVVPERVGPMVDMLSRSGIIGEMRAQNERISKPTRVRPMGYICNAEGEVVNTRDYVLIRPRGKKNNGRRAKLILCVGTAMNSGKSYAAAACCYALSSMDKSVRAVKVTGTAGLKDILLMQDTGAQHVADFTFFGHPSTYLLELDDLLHVFRDSDLKYGNNPRNYLVMELADGIFQRETAMLLHNPQVQNRVYRLVLCARDAAGVLGGLNILKDSFGLVPQAISGLCSSSPLTISEIASFTSIPVLRSMERDFQGIYTLIR